MSQPFICRRPGCGRQMPELNSMGTKRKFCSQRCAGKSATKINIPPRAVHSNGPTESWWLDVDHFYRNARAKFPEAYA